MDDAEAAQAVLSPVQLRQVEEAVEEVVQRSGWGRVTIVVEKGKVVKLELAPSLWLDRSSVGQN